MLIPFPNVKNNNLGENHIWQVPYFVKTGPSRYHKIMIPAQHWCKRRPFFKTFGGARFHKVEFASQEVKGSLVLLWAVRLFSS
jgi:hypothetical protein